MKTGIEHIIAPLVNRNANDLKIGFIGGDVDLVNLAIKESALDSLDLPIKLKFGHVNRITLKIPWRTYATSPTTISTIIKVFNFERKILAAEGVYLILVPNQGIEYNEQKAHKIEQEKKKAALDRLEQIRLAKRKPDKEGSETFAERVISQVVKNLQITIKDVHVLYEDRYSSRRQSFSAGISIEQLNFDTTDSNYQRKLYTQAEWIFYKLVPLKNFGIYLIRSKELISDLKDKNEIIKILNQKIARDDNIPTDLEYILKPLSITAKLKLNQRPENDSFEIPKVDLRLGLKSLVLALKQAQYQDILLFLEAQERFNLAGKFLKYRPKNVFSYRGHYKEWWNYAKECVLDDIRKRKENNRNLKWDRIKEHRTLFKQYKNSWINIRTEKAPKKEDLNIVERAEKILDLFNLNIARQMAETEIDHKNWVRVEDQEAEGWVSWTLGFFYSGSSKKTDQRSNQLTDENQDIITQLQAAFDDEDRKQLYDAIGYQENMPKTDYPEDFVENMVNLSVDSLCLMLDDVVKMTLNKPSILFEQRPSANGLNLHTKIKSIEMEGLNKASIVELLNKNVTWLDFQYQQKPLEDPSIDQMITLKTEPILMKYSASAVNQIIDLFKPPESVRLHQLLTIAFARYEVIKEQSLIGMKHFIDSKPKLHIDIKLSPSLFAICNGGEFSEDKPCLLMEFGEFTLRTENEVPSEAIKLVVDENKVDKRILSLIPQAYNNFAMNLMGLKTLLAKTYQDCFDARKIPTSKYHLIEPADMKINALQGILDDINFTRYCIFGSLPDIILRLSANKIIHLLELVNSIPLPQFEESAQDALISSSPTSLRDRAKMRAIMEVNEEEEIVDHVYSAFEKAEKTTDEDKKDREFQKQFVVEIELKKLGLSMFKKSENGNELRNFFDAHIERMTLKLEKYFYEMRATTNLKSITLKMHQADGADVKLIDSGTIEKEAHLFSASYLQKDPGGRNYESEDAQNIDINFQTLNFNLDKDSLADLMHFALNLQKRLLKIQQSSPTPYNLQPRNASITKHNSYRRTFADAARKTSFVIQQMQRRASQSRDSTASTPISATPQPGQLTTIESAPGSIGVGKAKPASESAESKRINFSLKMNKITALMLAKLKEIKGGLELNKKGNESTNENERGEFGAIDISSLLITGHMIGEIIMADITLESFKMEDRRPGVKAATLMDRKFGAGTSSSSPEKFIAIKYQQNAIDRDVKVVSSKFYLILAPEFLGVLVGLLSFVTTSGDDESEEEENDSFPIKEVAPVTDVAPKHLQVPSTVITPASPSEERRPTGERRPTSLQIPPAEAAAPAPLNMFLKCVLSEIEVILLENSLDPDNSQALIMSFNASVDGKTIKQLFEYNCALKDLQIASTYFDLEKRHLTNYNVLQKFNVEVKGRMNQLTNKQDIDVQPDNVHIALSPAVVRLLSAVSSQFSAHQTSLSSKPVETKLKTYANFWTNKVFNRDQFWWFVEADLLKKNKTFEITTAGCRVDEEENNDDDGDFLTASETVTESLRVNDFNFRLEISTDETAKPMIQVESEFGANVFNWSKNLNAEAYMKLRASYFNQAYRTWEPLIEPVYQIDEEEPNNWKSWELKLRANASTNVKKPKMSIKLFSQEVLNLTLTKSFIELSGELSESFQRAAKQIAPPKSRYELPGKGTYVILNDTGIPISLLNSNHLYVNNIECNQGTPIDLNFKKTHRRTSSGLNEQRNIEITASLLNTERIVNVSRVQKHCIPLPKEADSGKQWILLTDIVSEHSRYLVTLRSLVSIMNHFETPVEVYIENDNNPQEKILCGQIGANGGQLNIPMPLLYTASGNFYFKLITNDQPCEISNEHVCWHEFLDEQRSFARCDLTNDMHHGFYLEIVHIGEDVPRTVQGGLQATAWTIHLFPPISFINLLPVPLQLVQPLTKELNVGESADLNLVAGLVLDFSLNYNDKQFTMAFPIPRIEQRETLQMVRLTSPEDNDELFLGMNWSTENLRTELVIYAPYWMVNKTGMPLQYKEQLPKRNFCSPCYEKCRRRQRSSKVQRVTRHEAGQNPLILPLYGVDFFGKKKALVLVSEHSAYSNEFPLDTAGTVGRVICPGIDATRDYELSVEINLSQSGLTKIVTISPFYLIQNDSKFAIDVREECNRDWTTVHPESVVGFWPLKCAKERRRMIARFPETRQESAPFPYGVQFEGFSKIENELIGVHVHSAVNESSSVIHVEPFSTGMIPAILINDTNYAISYKQKDGADRNLNPRQMVPFAWDSLLIERQMEWASGDHEGTNSLQYDGSGTYIPSAVESHYHWISFLSGKQRYFVFTSDEDIEKCVRKFEDERFNTEFVIDLNSIGLSLLDNHNGYEILYAAISSSEISWQTIEHSFCTGEYFKSVSPDFSDRLEELYQQYIKEENPAKRVHCVKIDNKYEIDLRNLKLMRINKKKPPKTLHRTYRNGLNIIYKQSDHQTHMHVELAHMQIDNQLPTRIFPCILSMSPMPKALIATSRPKPFVAFSLVMTQAEHSSVPQIKYLHALVQEFAISLDTVFINAILQLFAKESLLPSYTKTAFDKDMETVRTTLNDIAVKTSLSQVRTYYELMEIAPLMIHLSFAQGIQDKKHPTLTPFDIQWSFLNLLFKSVGLTVTEIQDACFKMQPFQRKTIFYSNQQLTAEIQAHYQVQILKQAYKFLLGLDILGNPYGLITDLAGGVQDLFYHPFQGLILGPEEFASGLAMGVQSLYSSVVGGAFNAASRIGGTVGKGVAFLTFDDEYQRQRFQQSSQKPTDITQGLFRGVHGVGRGFVEGMTGVVTQPIQGAQTEGISGLAKGIGKGLVGAVARPVSSVVDGVTGTLDSAKSMVGISSKETGPLRPPRIIGRDKIIKPYIFEDAMGNNILNETDGGKYEDDEFVVYGPISENCAFLVTNKRVMLSKRGNIVGKWAADWTLNYDEIKEPMLFRGNGADILGIKLEFKNQKRGFLGTMFDSGSKGKVIQFNSPKVAQRIAELLVRAYQNYVS